MSTFFCHLDKYCVEFDVGIVGFMPSRDETFVGAALRNTPAPLLIDTNVRVKVSKNKHFILFLLCHKKRVSKKEKKNTN